MNVYLLPGLGADERLFKYLDLSGYNVTPVKWLKPKKKESIEEYASRIISQIKGSDVALIGVSFGGVMSIEIGKILSVKKIILISSVENFKELPSAYRVAGKLRLQRFLNGPILKNSHRLLNWMMGAADPLRKELLADMLRDADEDFLYWALNKIVAWKNSDSFPNVYRIHGDRDRVLPFRKADYVVKGGGHIMVANRADEVSAIIKHILSHRNR